MSQHYHLHRRDPETGEDLGVSRYVLAEANALKDGSHDVRISLVREERSDRTRFEVDLNSKILDGEGEVRQAISWLDRFGGEEGHEALKAFHGQVALFAREVSSWDVFYAPEDESKP
ncbi:hypothetical protein [Glycomyces sp. NPDC047010]|uniref:hypothetical protein n=1 Tax=Glycomyces sp. NPDC047010 TaxID=3155023 RepID=UPI0033FE8D7D